MALPYREDNVAKFAADMVENGFDAQFPIRTWRGKILDGRHRYEASQVAGVDPVFLEFEGSEIEAFDHVQKSNVENRHLSAEEKEYWYFQRANCVGVREAQRPSESDKNLALIPSQADHAKSLGVTRQTVGNWEKTRKAITNSEELKKEASTPEGYKKVKKEVSRIQKVDKAKTAIKPDEWSASIIMFASRYKERWIEEGKTPEQMASELLALVESGSTASGISKDFEALQLLSDLLSLALSTPRERPNFTLVN